MTTEGTGVAAVSVVAVVALWGSLRGSSDDGGHPGGGASVSVSAGPAASASAGSAPASAGSGTAGAIPAITIGLRVPGQGVISLGVGELRRYRLHLDADRNVYVTGYACSDLVPWQLFHSDGGLVGSNTLGCRQSGPYALDAGDYELRVGGPGVDGKYALKLVDR